MKIKKSTLRGWGAGLFFILLLGIFFLFEGCAQMRNSEFLDHPTMYQSWDHMKFSLSGYNDVDRSQIVKEAREAKNLCWEQYLEKKVSKEETLSCWQKAQDAGNEKMKYVDMVVSQNWWGIPVMVK
jgi:hypothetical protein